jgi:hypothetical protein
MAHKREGRPDISVEKTVKSWIIFALLPLVFDGLPGASCNQFISTVDSIAA